ncbi:DnaJ protein [Tanacetum coccineum]
MLNGNGDEKDGVTSPKVTIPRISRTASTGFLPSSLPKSMSQRRSKTPDCIRPVNSLLRSLSTKNMDSNYFNGAPSLSRRNSSTIVYSNANGLQKPPDMALNGANQRCVLHLITNSDPCFNVKQHLSVESSVVPLLFFGRLVGGLLFLFFKRSQFTSKGHGERFQEWVHIRQKCCESHIKFAVLGANNLRSSSQPPEIGRAVANAIFKRYGDDLEVSVEFPLVDALTGCALAIPSLGGLELCLMIDERITPGYKKTLKDRA